jgi:hypothetical protein
MPYEAKLPPGMTLPEGHRIDTSHARYKALEALATSQKWSQDSFSGALGIEAGRVNADHATARAAAPAPAPAPKVNFSKMTTTERFAHSLANSPGRRT